MVEIIKIKQTHGYRSTFKIKMATNKKDRHLIVNLGGATGSTCPSVL